MGTSTILSFSIGSIVGIFAAWHRGGRMDSILSPLTLVMQAIPLWWSPAGALPVRGEPRLAAHRLRLQPGDPPDWGWEHIKSSCPRHHAGGHPGHGAGGGFLITMRNNMINLLGEDYITMAKAKGLSSNRVIFNYGARNAMLPSVTALSMALGFVIGGSSSPR